MYARGIKMQEKIRNITKKNNRLQRTEAGILYLRDVKIYRNMNPMPVSVDSMMLSGMARQTEYSLFFSSHRMEPRESCPEMN